MSSPHQAFPTSGHVAVIAGPHCRRGRATARALLTRGAHLVLVGGEDAAVTTLRRNLLDHVPSGNVTVIPVVTDAGEAAAPIRAAAATVLASHPRVDLLVNNNCPSASAAAPPIDETPAASIDATGHFVLTSALMAGLRASPNGRIVTVTPRSDAPASAAEEHGSPDFSLLDFTTGLHAQLQRSCSSVRSVAADPGHRGRILSSQFAVAPPVGALTRRLAHNWEVRHAAPQIRAATEPRNRGGEVFLTGSDVVHDVVRRPLGAACPAVLRRWHDMEDLHGTWMEGPRRELGIVPDQARIA